MPNVSARAPEPAAPTGPRDAEPTGETGPRVDVQALVQSCTDLVQAYRDQRIGLGQATIQLSALLPKTPEGIQAFHTYAQQLEDVAGERASAALRGAQIADAQRRGVDADDAREDEQSPEPQAAPDLAGLKRARDEALETSEARPAANELLYGWKDLPVVLDVVDPSIKRTLDLKANYLLDVKRAKNDLLVRADCPDFPDSLWNDVLLDRFVDLDRVYTGHYALEGDYRHTQTIGELDISLNTGGSAKPSKVVRSHGEWSIAFAKTRAAMLFAYPHRSKELAEYEKFITEQFAAGVEQSRVLNLDRAIRMHVSRNNEIALDHFDKFGALVTRHVIVGGVQQSKKRRPNPSDAEVPICQRWNAGRCVSDTCRFRHVCLNCQQKHQAKNCAGGPKGDDSK